MLRKIIVIIISFVTIGMMGSCEEIFNDLAVNPNQFILYYTRKL